MVEISTLPLEALAASRGDLSTAAVVGPSYAGVATPVARPADAGVEENALVADLQPCGQVMTEEGVGVALPDVVRP